MNSIGRRLKEERESLALSQSEFAELVGASRRTAIAWEKGDSSPTGVQLSVLADHGFDVLYILTGKRTGEPVPLKPDESALLENYRAASAENKDHMKAVGAAFAQSSVNASRSNGE